MASAMAANSTTVHNVGLNGRIKSDRPLIAAIQVRSNRATNMSASGMNSDRSRGPHAGMGKGFGAGKSSWNSNIWGDNLGSGFDGELMDRARDISILSLPRTIELTV